jgi:hypothetical protein
MRDRRNLIDNIGDAVVQLLEWHPDLPPRKVGAQTEVGAASAVSEVRVEISGDVEQPLAAPRRR